MVEKEFATEEEAFLWYCNLNNLGPSALSRDIWLAGRASIRDVPDDFVIHKTLKIKELEKELELTQALADSFAKTKSACGHLQVYMYTEIGASGAMCTICEIVKLRKELKERIDQIVRMQPDPF